MSEVVNSYSEVEVRCFTALFNGIKQIDDVYASVFRATELEQEELPTERVPTMVPPAPPAE